MLLSRSIVSFLAILTACVGGQGRPAHRALSPRGLRHRQDRSGLQCYAVKGNKKSNLQRSIKAWQQILAEANE